MCSVKILTRIGCSGACFVVYVHLLPYAQLGGFKRVCACLHRQHSSLTVWIWLVWWVLDSTGFSYVFLCVAIDLNNLFIFSSSSTADNGSTLSSEAVTDSATSTDNNYGYAGTDTHISSGPPLSLCSMSPQPDLQLAPCEQLWSLTGFLCVFVHQDRSLSNVAQSSITFTT